MTQNVAGSLQGWRSLCQPIHESFSELLVVVSSID